jgi:hypothetical protein
MKTDVPVVSLRRRLTKPALKAGSAAIHLSAGIE